MTGYREMKKLLLATCFVVATMPAMASDLGCFVRHYDRAHLARHPDQLVTSVKLRITRPPPDIASADYSWFDLEATMRGRNKALHSTGLCSKESGLLRCYVECDGGGVKVSIRSNHVMMYLDRIRVAECGKELTVDGDDNEDISGGIDDRVFRLNRVRCGR